MFAAPCCGVWWFSKMGILHCRKQRSCSDFKTAFTEFRGWIHGCVPDSKHLVIEKRKYCLFWLFLFLRIAFLIYIVFKIRSAHSKVLPKIIFINVCCTMLWSLMIFKNGNFALHGKKDPAVTDSKKKTDVTGFWSNDVNQAHQSEPTPTNQEKHIFLHIFFTVVSHIPNIWLLVDWVKMKKIFFYCFLFLRIAFLFYKDFRIRSAHAERVKN